MNQPHLDDFSLLLVEDSPTDQKLFSLAIKDLAIPLSVVSNGEEALKWIRAHASSLPKLIFLDLNIPIKDGFEVLSEIKSDPTLKIIPVVVFSTSSSQKDIQRCYRLGANSFISKPLDLDKYLDVVKTTVGYWNRYCAHT